MNSDNQNIIDFLLFFSINQRSGRHTGITAKTIKMIIVREQSFKHLFSFGVILVCPADL